MNRRTWFAGAATTLLLLGMGCMDEGLTGTYHATSFTVAPTGGTATDVLAAGGTITLTIAADMSTSGSMKIPAGVQGGPSTVSLLGTANRLGDEVTLSLAVDSFLRDATWTFDGSSLSTVHTSSSMTAVVVLSK
ncbi:MAG TPA: hypothetical protein VFO55_01350 [Gemmatimonadaceae bacterium]|nr:hypothetical protein [Gemmatimonadaceae bacterium]